MKLTLTPGELAKLAGTTKRTVLFYDQKGILKPTNIASNGYRSYENKQILEYQMILLLTTLGVSLEEIQKYLSYNGSLDTLFEGKKESIKKQIRWLSFNLTNLETYLSNLKANGTMVNPKKITMKPFEYYFIEKIGSYAKIKEYCEELANMFSTKGKSFTTLTVFSGQNYEPRSSHMKIGALVTPGVKIKKEYEAKIKKETYYPGKVLTYTHRGSANLLSLFWKELEKYAKLHTLPIRSTGSDFEIYRKVNSHELTKQYFEIYLPIQ
jgi:DNA-binding transcriptional MerR regulator